MEKTKYSLFHVFDWSSEGTDEFFESYDKAISYYVKLGEQGHTERRLYEEVYYGDKKYAENAINPDEENCLESDDNWIGDYDD